MNNIPAAVDFSLLKKISETPGVSGYEKSIRDFLVQELKTLGVQYSIDAIGNLIVLKKGRDSSKRVLVAAHMDEIGFIVTHVDSQGFVRFNALGGFDPKTLTSQRVIVHGKKDLLGVMGSKPVHVMTADEKNKPAKLEDFFIDLGLPKEEVDKYVSVGTPITRERTLEWLGDCVNGKSLDNRISVFILLETLKCIGEIPYDLYAAFTVQEEVGLRGAQVAAHTVNPDFAIGLDTTIAYDVPGAREYEKVTELGKGTAIKILDSSAIADYRMVNYMKKTADKHQIKWQPELLTAGGTDTAPLQRFGKNGSIAGAVSIPTRHIHQVIETIHKDDILQSIHLLKVVIEELDTYNWDHAVDHSN
ncbi:MAG TPA: M42 family metallopeptidase [Cytophagaceae bacterium]|jgi:putative aminopeptidase FrvX|nr:M42 family metallopeptidase [Cytophagaceae bacterium]